VRRERHNFRFSLLELVIVMAVMGTILAVTAPSLAGFVHGRSVREEARRLVALTQRAAAVAGAQSCRTRLWIEPATGSYGWRLVETFATETVDEALFSVASGITLEVEPSPASGVLELTFRPDGEIEGADENLRVRFVAGGNRESSEVRLLTERGVFAVAEEVPEDAE
jgi:type II secretory pathway pseudopilin PulG